MSKIQPDGFVEASDLIQARYALHASDKPVVFCFDPAHVVAKLVEAGVLVRLSDPFDMNKGEPMYRINLPEEADDD